MMSDAHFVGKSAKSGLASLTLHGTICPAHGLPALLLKFGLFPAAVIAPLTAAHEYIVDKAAIPLEYLIQNQEHAHRLAHNIVDYGSLGLAIAIPAYTIGSYLYKRRRNNLVLESASDNRPI